MKKHSVVYIFWYSSICLLKYFSSFLGGFLLASSFPIKVSCLLCILQRRSPSVLFVPFLPQELRMVFASLLLSAPLKSSGSNIPSPFTVLLVPRTITQQQLHQFALAGLLTVPTSISSLFLSFLRQRFSFLYLFLKLDAWLPSKLYQTYAQLTIDDVTHFLHELCKMLKSESLLC